jgi:acetylornithine deacetylase
MSVPNVMSMLRTLVATPSVSCTSPSLDMSNLDVVHCLAEWLEDLGFHSKVQTLPGDTRKANLIARLGEGRGGLMLAGHTDTVPCDEHRWTRDPFKLTEVDGRLHGLGTSDMKGFFPIALAAAARFADAKLREPLFVLATADEESTMAGARALVDTDAPRARRAVIGEPTSLRPVRSHKGIMMLAIRVEGGDGHSSDPRLGINALDVMQSVMAELIAYRRELARNTDPAFEVQVPTLNLGCLHGGDNPNRICGRAELQIDMRILPGMDSDAVLEDLGARLQRLAEEAATVVTLQALYPPIPPFEVAEDAEFVKQVEKATGQKAGSVAFGTEGPFLQALGTETVVLGPGRIEQAHQPDEHLELASIQPTIDILERLIATSCL